MRGRPSNARFFNPHRRLPVCGYSIVLAVFSHTTPNITTSPLPHYHHKGLFPFHTVASTADPSKNNNNNTSRPFFLPPIPQQPTPTRPTSSSSSSSSSSSLRPDPRPSIPNRSPLERQRPFLSHSHRPWASSLPPFQHPTPRPRPSHTLYIQRPQAPREGDEEETTPTPSIPRAAVLVAVVAATAASSHQTTAADTPAATAIASSTLSSLLSRYHYPHAHPLLVSSSYHSYSHHPHTSYHHPDLAATTSAEPFISPSHSMPPHPFAAAVAASAPVPVHPPAESSDLVPPPPPPTVSMANTPAAAEPSSDRSSGVQSTCSSKGRSLPSDSDSARASSLKSKANTQRPTCVVRAGSELRLVTGAVVIPHPSKVSKGGEDAYFASPVAVGVFDGVGGWASMGVDPGLYSKQLAATTARLMDERGPHSALESLILAVKDNSAIGSSTACVVGLVQDNDSIAARSDEEPQTTEIRSSPDDFTSRPPMSPPRLVPSAVSKSDGSREISISPETSDVPAPQLSSTSSSLRTSEVGLAELPEYFGDMGQLTHKVSPSESSVTPEADIVLGTVNSDGTPEDEVSSVDESDGEAHEGCHPLARLLGVNLGDSGLIVIRNGRIVFSTTEQQHYFNCPFQVGSGTSSDSVDPPHVGEFVDFVVRPGDCIVLATDGLWDNVFPHEVLSIVAGLTWADGGLSSGHGRPISGSSETSKFSKFTSSVCSADPSLETSEPMPFPVAHPGPQRVSQALAEFAFEVARDDRRQSPFAVNAKEAGHDFPGGKMDDITVVTAFVACTEQISFPSSSVLPSSPISPVLSPSSSGSSPGLVPRDEPAGMDLAGSSKL